MVQHDFTYPLGHIVTARYWQNVADGGLHLTLSETGWAKAMWGKIYGQWLADRPSSPTTWTPSCRGNFSRRWPHYKVTSFCAPPTRLIGT
jgi:acetyl-CoA synthetase